MCPKIKKLEFELNGDLSIFIDMQNLFLELKLKILKHLADHQQQDETSSVVTERPFLAHSTFQLFSSECNSIANGNKIASASVNYIEKRLHWSRIPIRQENTNYLVQLSGILFRKITCW